MDTLQNTWNIWQEREQTASILERKYPLKAEENSTMKKLKRGTVDSRRTGVTQRVPSKEFSDERSEWFLDD